MAKRVPGEDHMLRLVTPEPKTQLTDMRTPASDDQTQRVTCTGQWTQPGNIRTTTSQDKLVDRTCSLKTRTSHKRRRDASHVTADIEAGQVAHSCAHCAQIESDTVPCSGHVSPAKTALFWHLVGRMLAWPKTSQSLISYARVTASTIAKVLYHAMPR